MELLTAHDVARILRTTAEVIYSAAWRQRVGLGAVRIGRALRFRVADVEALIERGAETSRIAAGGRQRLELEQPAESIREGAD
jgi:hypothetical protein